MGVKRNRRTRRSRSKRRRGSVASQIHKALNKNIETKTSVATVDDGVEIFHNNFKILSNTMLATTQGITDPETTRTNNRIGDKINLRGIKFTMMIENNERFSDVTYRLMLVRSSRGDTPTRSTMFNGTSGNKMIDTLNRERYSFLYHKVFKMKAAPMVPINADGGSTSINTLSGTPGIWTGSTMGIGKATRIIKVWIPGKKFTRSGVIQYENGGDQPKFFDYHLVLFAYANWTTYQDVWAVARINECQQVMYYKDA